MTVMQSKTRCNSSRNNT